MNVNFLTWRFRAIANRRKERIIRDGHNARRIAALEKWIPKAGIGAELGVYKGEFSRFLFNHLTPQKLYLIDGWYITDGAAWTWGVGSRSTIDGLCEVLHLMAPELIAGQATVIIQDDLKALADMPDHHLNWAYIDTSHRYKQTMLELDLLKLKVKPNGIICGDDWREDPNHPHHGVCQAVQEFSLRENYRLILKDIPSAQWAIRKESPRTDSPTP